MIAELGCDRRTGPLDDGLRHQYLEEILEGFGQRERLASSADYEQMDEVMNKLAPGERSGWAFGRSDEEFRPMFDLIRQGRMPESKSMLGKLLNKILTTEAEKSWHAAEADDRRRNLPDFEAVRRYFGPHAPRRPQRKRWLVHYGRGAE